MSKQPAFQFYPGDWMKDPALRACSLPARGLWTDMLCLMFESQRRGYLTLNGKPVSAEQLARMVGSTVDEVSCLLAELIQSGVVSQTDTHILYSRRMVRDTELSQKRAKAGKKGGNPKLLKRQQLNEGENILLNQNASKTQPKRNQNDKQNTTPSSSSSTSVYIDNNKSKNEKSVCLSKIQAKPPTANYSPNYIGCELDISEWLCNEWNEFAKHRVKDADRLGVAMKINDCLQRLHLTLDGLKKTLSNYREAVTAPNTKSKHWSIGRWLMHGCDNYTPNNYARDNYVWSEQDNRQPEIIEI